MNPADQLFVLGGSAIFSVVTSGDTYQWEESIDGGTIWNDIVDGGDYSGATTTDLTISNLIISEYTNMYRVRVSSVAYACDPVTTSLDATFVNNLVDTDNDGVFDLVDQDDDNDGILDSDEGDATDTNGDGIFDRLSLDADEDGCNDVTEAGFTDNGVGMLGTLNPPTVDATTGLVTSATDGYTTPNDLDLNGIYDFQEIGTASDITAQPVDAAIALGDDATFSVVGNATFYQWQESLDNGSNWNDIIDGGIYSGATTVTLTITSPPEAMSGYVYRVQLSSPDFACDPNPVLNSAGALLLINVLDWDNDGVYDINDLDDDNDGITDVDEYDGLPPLADSDDPFGPEYDIDSDGIPNQFDDDSDGDNCYDVTEAGFTDNGFGMLGTLNPPTVDADGLVDSATDGYTPPNDLDNNGVDDFMEAGSSAVITTDPVNQDFDLGGSATFDVVATADTYQWEESIDGVNWTVLVDDATYSGTTTASLTVSNLVIANYFSMYRVQVSNIAYACDPGTISLTATYNDLTDTDSDGVFDIVDVDDDNDGIYDTVEGEFTDSNFDTIPDRISLNSDPDLCPDVVEAGFEDPDINGVVGTSPVIVDIDGKVVSDANGPLDPDDAYDTPLDGNENGVFDFQEEGSPSVINNQPEDIEITLGDDATFEVDGDATFFQWETSLDDGATWFPLTDNDQFDGTNTDRLRVYEVYGLLESSLYRVVLTSPDFACDPNPVLVSDEAMLSFNTELIPSGFSPNGDGANDLFTIPGLDQYPNFKIEIFNRWGSKVYSYNNNGSANPDWWDGFSSAGMTIAKDRKVPVGTYFYALYFNGDGEEPKSGWVYVNY